MASSSSSSEMAPEQVAAAGQHPVHSISKPAEVPAANGAASPQKQDAGQAKPPKVKQAKAPAAGGSGASGKKSAVDDLARNMSQLEVRRAVATLRANLII